MESDDRWGLVMPPDLARIKRLGRSVETSSVGVPTFFLKGGVSKKDGR